MLRGLTQFHAIMLDGASERCESCSYRERVSSWLPDGSFFCARAPSCRPPQNGCRLVSAPPTISPATEAIMDTSRSSAGDNGGRIDGSRAPASTCRRLAGPPLTCYLVKWKCSPPRG